MEAPGAPHDNSVPEVRTSDARDGIHGLRRGPRTACQGNGILSLSRVGRRRMGRFFENRILINQVHDGCVLTNFHHACSTAPFLPASSRGVIPRWRKHRASMGTVDHDASAPTNFAAEAQKILRPEKLDSWYSRWGRGTWRISRQGPSSGPGTPS